MPLCLFIVLSILLSIYVVSLILLFDANALLILLTLNDNRKTLLFHHFFVMEWKNKPFSLKKKRNLGISTIKQTFGTTNCIQVEYIFLLILVCFNASHLKFRFALIYKSIEFFVLKT